jgi:hypothetical protein
MKKIAFIAIIALAGLASCKKDRTCTCVTTRSGSSGAETEVTTYSGVTKKSAKATCTSGTSYDMSDPGDVRTRDCQLN